VRGISWLLIAALAACVGPGAWAARDGQGLRYQEAWYQENGLHDLARAAEVYRSVAAVEACEPARAARALLRAGACYRELGKLEAASQAELEARRRFPSETTRYASYRLEVLHKQLDEAFNVADAATASQAIVRFLEDLDVAAVHSICESCYGQALERRARDPLGSIPDLRKAVAISTYLRQLERSAFARKDIADIYASAGRADEAIAEYRKVQEDFPNVKNVGAWAQLSIAEIQRLRGRLAEAVEAYRAVRRTYPGQLVQVAWAQLWMGDAFRVAGKMADASAAWRWLLEEFNEPTCADQIAIAARLLGQARKGEAVRFPRNEFANDLAYFLAVEQELAGKPARARKHYERCIALSKGDDWPRALAAQALEAGQAEETPKR